MHLSSKEAESLEAIDIEAIVSRAVAWSNLNSGSRHLAGLEAVRQILMGAFADLPAEPQAIPLPPTQEIAADGVTRALEHPPSIGLTVRPAAPVQVVLTGHYDTVYGADSPFQTVRKRADGALHGPGIADMKGGLSVMLAALHALEAHPDAARLGYRVLISPDEEIGSLASASELARIGALGHVGLTYEPALADGTLASARKGSGNFHFRIRGRAAHAGRDFAAGRNAMTAAAKIAVALDALNGGRDGVTVNVARIDGGAPLNMVPDLAIVRFNVRFPDAESVPWLERSLTQILEAGQSEGITVERHGGLTRPAKPFNAAQAQLFASVRKVGALLGQSVDWKPSGGVCEGNNLFAAGLPGVDTLGVRGGDIHSENEFAWPESFGERARLSALLLMKLAGGEIDGPALRAAMSEASC